MTMSAKQYLRLLGPVRLEYMQKGRAGAGMGAGGEMPRFRSKRTVALLGYLVAERRAVARDSLSALLWPDEELSTARANLRRELYNLAQIFPGCWEMERQSVAFAAADGLSVDIYELSESIGIGQWEEAATLLGGDFLEGVALEENAEFERWLLAKREGWRGKSNEALAQLVESQTKRGRFSEALQTALRLLQLAPWNEEAHRQVMRLLAWTGQRGGALHQFELCRESLRLELGVEPDEETRRLCQQIEAGDLAPPPSLPAFLSTEGARHKDVRPGFVGRQRELALLEKHLKGSLAGRGQLVFLTGDPGRGKTALLEAFIGRAHQRHPELLIASGNCTAYSSVGDPYLPFREVMGMLTGDVEARWDAGTISREHARRLWSTLPEVVQAVVDQGPHLLGILLPGQALLSRAVISGAFDGPRLARLREQIQRRDGERERLEQRRALFQQLVNVLVTVAHHHPLLLVLDDIQWIDTASASLLFHLGRCLANLDSRILIVSAYRPAEVAIGSRGRRHPLSKALTEFKRLFGDVWIKLGHAEADDGRTFVNALLDLESNRLGRTFRESLFQRTRGHPLFTVELLRAMRERGDLLRDGQGQWTQAPGIDWEVVPARVEAAIEERITRLDPILQQVLALASVEGEVFTAQVLARALKMAEWQLLRLLSAELERRHYLVIEQEELELGQRRLSRFRFSHVLIREFVYGRLGTAERRVLHTEIAETLETVMADQLGEIAVQLGHHFELGGEYGWAVPHFIEAGDRAARLYAFEEAAKHFGKAIRLGEHLPLDAAARAHLYRQRGLALDTLGEFESARIDLEMGLDMAEKSGLGSVAWRLSLDLGKLWASRDYQRSREYFETALKMARHRDDPAALASSLNWMGNWHANAEEPEAAKTYHQEALEIFERSEDLPGVAKTGDLLGIASLLAGDLTASVGYYDQAVALFEELDDRRRLLSSLMGRGTTVSLLVLLASAPAPDPPHAEKDIREAMRLAQQIRSPHEEAWASWSLGSLYTVQGRYGAALEIMERGLQVAQAIEHREWEVGNRFALGVLYCEMLSPEVALEHLERALDQASGIRSQYWLNHVGGALATAYLVLGDTEQAQSCLESVIPPGTPTDTMGRRYCWARRAELALRQGELELALNSVDRLIGSAPGMRPGSAISFLWLLKGEILAASGQWEQAAMLLQEALTNARLVGERFLLWRIYASMSRLLQLNSQVQEAAEARAAARAHVEELAATIPGEGLRKTFLRRADDWMPPLPS